MINIPAPRQLSSFDTPSAADALTFLTAEKQDYFLEGKAKCNELGKEPLFFGQIA